ncbi:MAG: glycosyltransferase family 4 protein [Altererythrobacter sp.]|nr:glycosyltransferase family 4 protein [Altererythrobacter sp.]
MAADKPRILHCLHDGALIAEVAAGFGAIGFEAAHTIALANPNASYDKSVLRANNLTIARDFPVFGGSAGPGRLIAIGNALARYDLVVTYGWDAINVAMAHKVFGQHLKLPPLVHREQGSADFLGKEKGFKRKLLRRIALSSANSLVTGAPSIDDFAQKHWSVAAARIAHIQPGIELKRFRPSAKPDALPGLVKRSAEHWIGAHLSVSTAASASKLVQSLQDLPRDWHLVLTTDQAPKDEVRTLAETLEVSHRVHVLDRLADEAKAMALFDIYVELGSPFEAAPRTMQAMAAATPVIRHGNADLTTALDDLIEDNAGRRALAKTNRETALAQFDKAATARTLGSLYQAAIAG